MRRVRSFAFVIVVLLAARVALADIPSPTSLHRARLRKAMLAFNRRALHDVYAARGHKNEKWDKLVTPFLDGMALYFANFRAEPIYRLGGMPATNSSSSSARRSKRPVATTRPCATATPSSSPTCTVINLSTGDHGAVRRGVEQTGSTADAGAGCGRRSV
jgi:hypothetical protein